MIDLFLKHHHRMDSESYDDFGDVVHKWDFLDRTMNTDDLDMRIIRYLFQHKCNLQRLKQFALDDKVVLILDNEIIIYTLDDSFTVYAKGKITNRKLLDLVLENVETSDGIDLENHYDVVNRNIITGKLKVSLDDMFRILDVICLAKEQDITLSDGSSVHTSYKGETCKIGKETISTIDVLILKFIFTVQDNLLSIKTFSIDNMVYVLTEHNLIRYSCLEDIDYFSIDDGEFKELLEFICDVDAVKHEEEKEPKQKRKKGKDKKEKTDKEDIKIVHKGNSIIEKVKSKLLFLIKKPQ